MRQNDVFRKYFFLQKGVKIKKKKNKPETNKNPTNKPAHASEDSDKAGSGFVGWLRTQLYFLRKSLSIAFGCLDDQVELGNWDL